MRYLRHEESCEEKSAHFFETVDGYVYVNVERWVLRPISVLISHILLPWN